MILFHVCLEAHSKSVTHPYKLQLSCRRAKTSDELKPFEAVGAVFVLRGFQLDATHNDEAEDQVLCQLSPYHATKAADEAYLVPLRSFLLHKVRHCNVCLGAVKHTTFNRIAS